MKQVIIIGDSSHNTLSAVRSFGEAGIPLALILVCLQDVHFVQQSKYLKSGNCYVVPALDGCHTVLERLHEDGLSQILMTTFDAAAQWVDEREKQLSKWFQTPCRGKQLGKLFNKAEQCKLAAECGLLVPKSVIYTRVDLPLDNSIPYPLITKPLVSSEGEKGDIHICNNSQELDEALALESHCEKFLIQEYIKKDFEINALGVSTDKGVVFGGAIHKVRHWPPLVGTCSFGVFDRIASFNLDLDGIRCFLEHSGYHGSFSVEFVHTKEGSNYFMEVNFRNDGLAYASTCAGANLHALYADGNYQIDWKRFRRTYMMNYSIDLLYVKQGRLSWYRWLWDFLRTRCFINFCWSDLGPLIAYYKAKWKRH